MKICWDNLEKIKYKNKKFLIKRKVLHLKICKTCNEEYLGSSESSFCCGSCSSLFNRPRQKISEETRKKLSISNSGVNNPMYKHIYTEKTKEKMRKNNKGENNPAWRCGKLSWYDTYAPKISWAEEVRRAPDNENILEVKCKYCGKWYKPKSAQVGNRIIALNCKTGGEHGLYCSEECKNACPIYKRSVFPRGFVGDDNSSREVQPELRKLVLERDDYTCQKCGLNSNNSCVELHCHHINPVKLDPIESADIDNCITLCKDCHHEAHQKDGCSTGFLANCIKI